MVGVMKTLRPALAFLGSMSVLVATEQKPILIQVPSRPPVFISAPFGDGLRPGSLRREPILVIQRCGQANVPAVDENGRPVHGTVPRILVRQQPATTPLGSASPLDANALTDRSAQAVMRKIEAERRRLVGTDGKTPRAAYGQSRRIKEECLRVQAELLRLSRPTVPPATSADQESLITQYLEQARRLEALRQASQSVCPQSLTGLGASPAERQAEAVLNDLQSRRDAAAFSYLTRDPLLAGKSPFKAALDCADLVVQSLDQAMTIAQWPRK